MGGGLGENGLTLMVMSLGLFLCQQADHPAPRTDSLPKTRPRCQQQVLATGPSQPRGPWQQPAFQAQNSWRAWGPGMCVCAGSGGGWEGDTCDSSNTCETPSVQACAAPRPTEWGLRDPYKGHLGCQAGIWRVLAAAWRPQGPS